MIHVCSGCFLLTCTDKKKKEDKQTEGQKKQSHFLKRI